MLLEGSTTFFGCEDVFFKDGIVWNARWGIIPKLQFPPGMIEDWLFWTCNNNLIFAQFLATLNHPYSRSARRFTFYIVNSYKFLWFCLLVVFGTVGLGKQNLAIVNVLVVSPQLLVLNIFLKYLYTCSCFVKDGDEEKESAYFLFFKKFGISISYAMWLAAALLYSVFSTQLLILNTEVGPNYTSDPETPLQVITTYRLVVHVVVHVVVVVVLYI